MGQDYYYNEIVVRNKTSESVTDVSIKVAKTLAVFRCGYIAPAAICSNKFPKKKYLGNPVHITWKFHNTKKETDSFVLEVPKTLDAKIPMMGILEINNDGRINAFLSQR